MTQLQGLPETASLIARSAATHLRYFKPTLNEMSPPMYAGKAETTWTTMVLDMMGYSITDMPDPYLFTQFNIGASLGARVYDEVVEEAKPHADDTVTHEDLRHTPVFHPLAGSDGRMVTGAEAWKIVLDASVEMIPGTDSVSRKRKETIEDSMWRYTEVIAATANNSDYRKGHILPFDTAAESKQSVNDQFGESTVAMFAALLDVPGKEEEMRLFGHMCMAVQYLDDLFDWRKDWRNRDAKVAQSDQPIKPQENIFIATTQEDIEEALACEMVLEDTSQRSVALARELAPRSITAFQDRFQDTLDQFQSHHYTDRARRILAFMFHQILPRAPESGRFYDWARY